MAQTKAIQAACRLLRARVRLRRARLRLPTTAFPADDTDAIRESLRLYTESWIVPLLDAIETGDTEMMRCLTRDESGEDIGPRL